MRLNKILTSALLVGATSLSLHAAGAAAGTIIDNSATLDFEVGAVAQPQVLSNVDTFVVDNKIDMTIVNTDASIVIEAPGTNAVTTFSLTNTGNKTQDYILTAADFDLGTAFGATDNFNPDSYNVFVDSDADGIYTAAVDTALFVDELAPDATIAVFVVSAINAAQLTGDQSIHALTAQAAQGGGVGVQGAAEVATVGADTQGAEDIVFADAAGATDLANDGQISAESAIEVLIPAALSLTKSSIVTADPVNGAVDPKRIPGATIRFCFVVDNTGGATADNVIITDDMTVNNLDQLTLVQAGFVLQDIAVPCDCAAIVDASGNIATPSAVTVNLGTVTGTPTPATQRGCAYIEGTIN